MGAGVATRAKARFFSNFGHPRGVLGLVAGRLMASKNAAANRRLVGLLDIEPADTVLDVGCGPGVAVEAAAARASAGRVIGVDSSAVVLGLARRRNRRAVRDGFVELRCAPAEQLPLPDRSVDRACSMNSIGHWDDPDAGLREVARVVRPGGRLVLGLRSRACRGAPATTPETLARVVAAVAAAGFTVDGVREEAAGAEHFHAIRATRRD